MSRERLFEQPLRAPSTRRSRLSVVAAVLAAIPLLVGLTMFGLDLDLGGDLGEAILVSCVLCVPAALILGIVALLRHKFGDPRPGVALATLAVMVGGAEIMVLVNLLQGFGRGLHGRVLRVRGCPALPPVDGGGLSEGTASLDPPGSRGPSDVRALADGDRDALAAHWTLVAREEHASIAAFERLALALAAHGAPCSLVARAEASARQEADHAARGFALASTFAGRTLAPAAWHPDAEPTPSLVRLAVEALLDGCLGEGTGAAEAATLVAGRRTVDPVRATLVVIARDEAGHAEFSWAMLEWCLAVGGEPVHAAVEAAVATLRERPAPPTARDPGDVQRRFGVPTRAERDAAWRATLGAAVPRARALLRARSTRAA
jgi:hypothetical protein